MKEVGELYTSSYLTGNWTVVFSVLPPQVLRLNNYDTTLMKSALQTERGSMLSKSISLTFNYQWDSIKTAYSFHNEKFVLLPGEIILKKGKKVKSKKIRTILYYNKDSWYICPAEEFQDKQNAYTTFFNIPKSNVDSLLDEQNY
jgi:hypothetical protein